MNWDTAHKYFALFEYLFLNERLQAWNSSEYKRLVKMPKLYPFDTGLMCAIRGLNREHLPRQPEKFGLAVEIFVYNELCKQVVWERGPIRFYHYWDKDKIEVDIIIENAAGDCFAIEVNSGATLNARSFVGLKRFQKVAGKRFKLGVLL